MALKRFLVLFLFAALAGLRAQAQAVPDAYEGRFSITAGGLASAFQPNYAGGLVASEGPYRLYGIGAYVDVRFSRWVQLEAEGRWQRYNQYINIYQDNYLLGPKVPIHRFGRATPYAKVLLGFSHMNFEYNEATGRFTTIAYGGGLDYRLTRKISVRPIDFEYQQWPQWVTNNQTLHPYGASVGLSYKVF